MHMALQVKRGELPAPEALINLDTLGVREFAYDSSSDKTLSCLARQTAAGRKYDIRASRLTDMTGDWMPFKRAGIATLHLHSLDADSLRYLHTYRDRRDLVNDEEMIATFEIIADILATLDTGEVSPIR